MNDALMSRNLVTTCVSCGHDALYVQKDFNRQAGMAIVGLGIVASIYFFARNQPMFAMGALGLTAFVDLLRACGMMIAISGMRTAGGEQVGELEVAPGPELHPTSVNGSQAAEMIDELPVLAVAASQLPGTSRITGAAELRVKESDRIAAMVEGLSAMGADIKALDDGWVINGPRHLEGARVDSHRDHRVAMALAVAGLLADGATEIEDAECVEISYPGFFDQLESLWR